MKEGTERLKIIFLTVCILLFSQNLFSQEGFHTRTGIEIEVKVLKLIAKTYDVWSSQMERSGIDTSEYITSINIENNILEITYRKPQSMYLRGSPRESPARTYEVDITTGEIIRWYESR